jgi:hypothetical protein
MTQKLSFILKKVFFGTLFILFFTTCSKKDPEPIKPVNSINDLINSALALSDVEATSRVTTQTNNSVPTSSNNSNYSCDKKIIRFANKTDNISVTAFDGDNRNSADLYPGAIIRLKDLRQTNTLNSIGSFPRETASITSSLPFNGSSMSVSNPSKASVSNAINEIVSKFEKENGTVPANTFYTAKIAYSLQQGLQEFGVNAAYLGNSASAKFSVSNKVEDKTFFIFFKQTYHTVSFPYPSNPAGFFANNVNLDELKNSVQNDNPLGYISDVTYGRVIVAKLTYTSNISTQSTDLEANINLGLANIGGTFNAETQQILDDSQIEVAVLGGSADDAIAITTGDKDAENVIKKIDTYIKNGVNKPKLGKEISYTVKYLSNNSLFSVGSVTEYTEQACKLIPKKVSIKGINFRNIPTNNAITGNNWDGISDPPDLYYKVTDASNNVYLDGRDFTKYDISSSLLPVGWSRLSFEIPNWATTPIFVDCWDRDGFLSSDEFMGYVRFNMSDYITGANAFPNKVTKYGNTDVNSNRLQVELELLWE